MGAKRGASEERGGAEARALRMLPSVDDVLQIPRVGALATESPREVVVAAVRALLDGWRSALRSGELEPAEFERRVEPAAIAAAVEAAVQRDRRRGLRRAVNATGVVLHTGLGRAPVHAEAARAMADAAAGYCILEVDRESGERNERDERLSELAARLTGAEAAIAVNNNAAAVFLALSTFGRGREVVVSRGELVEIGGSFRMPAVMEGAGAVLREVGTTNRTHLDDYRAAIGERTGLLLKVHTSNFRIEGFVHEVSADELAALGAERGVPTYYDLGSGRLEGAGATSLDVLGPEPRVRDAVASGVDLVSFSGDKLLGAPQAGILAGKRRTVAALRKNPVYRAMRLDKVAIAGLERTLELFESGRGDELPARALIVRPEPELRSQAESIARAANAIAGFRADVLDGSSQPGSGSAPGIFLPTAVVRLQHARLGAAELARALRVGEPPVFARIQDAAVLCDPRTLLPGDEERLVEALRRVASV
jgi:L-seryl-tRNA(Ser) seleniumtransferase